MEKNKSSIYALEGLGTLIAGMLTSFATIHIYGMTTVTFLVSFGIQVVVCSSLFIKREVIAKDNDVLKTYRRIIFILTAFAVYFCVVAQTREPGTGGDIVMPTLTLIACSAAEVFITIVLQAKKILATYKRGKAVTQ